MAEKKEQKLIAGDIYGRQDCMSMVDANRIVSDIGSGGVATLEWLRDVIECDGTPNDSKFAAILRALILDVEDRP